MKHSGAFSMRTGIPLSSCLGRSLSLWHEHVCYCVSPCLGFFPCTKWVINGVLLVGCEDFMMNTRKVLKTVSDVQQASVVLFSGKLTQIWALLLNVGSSKSQWIILTLACKMGMSISQVSLQSVMWKPWSWRAAAQGWAESWQGEGPSLFPENSLRVTLPEGGLGRSSQTYPKKHPGWDVWEGLPDPELLRNLIFQLALFLLLKTLQILKPLDEQNI